MASASRRRSASLQPGAPVTPAIATAGSAASIAAAVADVASSARPTAARLAASITRNVGVSASSGSRAIIACAAR